MVLIGLTINCFHGNQATVMAAEVDSPPVVSTKRLEGSLVSPRSFKPVPNHLAETSESDSPMKTAHAARFSLSIDSIDYVT